MLENNSFKKRLIIFLICAGVLTASAVGAYFIWEKPPAVAAEPTAQPMIHTRIGALKPGFYTRMGAAVRDATQRLSTRPERQRLLLVLTDGKPNDIDVYEGRYGLEDTRHAIQEARAAGLIPFCVTIDHEAHQ